MMKTFSNRHTELKDFVEVKEMLLEDATHQLRWKAFTRSKKTLLLISFTEALEMIEKFINPVIIAILSKQILTKTWDHSTSQWK